MLALAAPLSKAAPEPVPVAVQTAPGRFEISAADSAQAHAVAAQAEEAWQHLTGPLGLPGAFPSPIFVRLVTTDAIAGGFDAALEPGGLVTLRLAAGRAPQQAVRRGLVHALLLRLAAAHHGLTARTTVPLWLEHAGVGWWETHARPAQLDAAKQAGENRVPPSLVSLLEMRAGAEPEQAMIAGLWLLTFLQNESTPAREWPMFLRRILGGEPARSALAAVYAGRFTDERERELWWQTGWHHARRARTLPNLDAVESGWQLASLARFVFVQPDEEADAVLPLSRVLERATEPIVGTELGRRSAELNRVLPILHPFYRNPGLSLAELLRGGSVRSAAKRDALCRAFERDWYDAMDVEAACRAALDAIERGRAGPPPPP